MPIGVADEETGLDARGCDHLARAVGVRQAGEAGGGAPADALLQPAEAFGEGDVIGVAQMLFGEDEHGVFMPGRLDCAFRKVPDTDYGKSWPEISVSRGQ